MRDATEAVQEGNMYHLMHMLEKRENLKLII